jgi:hypothetical protein
MATGSAFYAHRRNEDGTYDSICRDCFLAIARGKTESELAISEKSHVCDSSFLAERGHFGRSESLEYFHEGRSAER